MSEAIQTIYGVAQATGKSGPNPLEAPGALSGALDTFDVSAVYNIIYKIFRLVKVARGVVLAQFIVEI